MKLLYFLFALLSLATQLVVATPIADPDPASDTIEARGRDHNDNNNDHGWNNKNPCQVKQTYPYYKYPCKSSPSVGMSILGATFTSSCKYHWGIEPMLNQALEEKKVILFCVHVLRENEKLKKISLGNA
ncbi:hypothetical protein N7540_000744 [Penicillium herquei]|nr:hypothetical protein N7540_000744 [Penicillium herquei]